jgi:predicted  nucleic acid-binding Zn-ribbon protein
MNDKSLEKEVSNMEWTISHLVERIEELESADYDYRETIESLESRLESANDRNDDLNDIITDLRDQLERS